MTGRRLLLVDDDEIFAEVLAAALQRRGYAVDVAHTVADAERGLATNPPDGAILDLRIGTDTGLTLVQSLRRVAPVCRIVLLTGYGSIATAVEAIKLGATQYLTKPASVEEIIAALEDRAPERQPAPRAGPPSVRRLEWEHIQRVLMENDGNISATARALGMHRRTLQRKLQKRPVRE